MGILEPKVKDGQSMKAAAHIIRSLDSSGDIIQVRKNLVQICLHLSGKIDGTKFSPNDLPELPLSDFNVTKIALNETLGTKDLRQSVTWPSGCDLAEWLAKCLFESISDCQLIFTLIWSTCRCHVMASGCHVYARYAEENNKPEFSSARDYMKESLTYCVTMMNDHRIFGSLHEVNSSSIISQASKDPTKLEYLLQITRRCARLIFRIYAHLYRHHMNEFKQYEVVPHLNCCFKRLLFFAHEFDLISTTEVEPLRNIVDAYLLDKKKHENQKSDESTNVESNIQTCVFERPPIKAYILEHLKN